MLPPCLCGAAVASVPSASEPASPCRRGAPLSHCRFSSAGCAGLGQLCDAVRAVRCRSRFVLLAQQASSSLMPGARPARWSAVDACFTRPRRARVDAWKRGRMTAFLSPSGNGQWQWQLIQARKAPSAGAPHSSSCESPLASRVTRMRMSSLAASMRKVHNWMP